MTRPLASILIYCGFRQIPENGGLWNLYERVKFNFSDGKAFPFTAIRTWNANLKRDAARIKLWDSEKLIVVAHSYGVGNATYHLQTHLDRPIDLLISIDGVQRYGWFGNGVGFLPKLRAFRRGQMLRFEEAKVRKAASFITLNSAGWFCPMGHRIEGPEIVRDVVYGSDKEMASWWKTLVFAGVETQIDETMTHFTIDDDERVHDAVLHLIRNELGLPVQEAT